MLDAREREKRRARRPAADRCRASLRGLDQLSRGLCSGPGRDFVRGARRARRDKTTVEVGYALPLDGGYSLEVMPQPLTHPASLEIGLELPEDWAAWGPG